MNNIEEVTSLLKKELDDTPLIKEYKSLKEIISNSEEIKELKKQIIRSKNEGRNSDHTFLLEKYNNHPLIVNFENIKSELNEYLKELVSVINKDL